MLFGRFRNRDEAHTAPDPADRKVNNSIVSSATSEPAKRLSAAAFPGACFTPGAAMPGQRRTVRGSPKWGTTCGSVKLVMAEIRLPSMVRTSRPTACAIGACSSAR
jgi:hypothetical protein